MEFSEDYKNGVADAVTGVISLLFEEVDGELKEMILKRLNLREIKDGEVDDEYKE